MHIAKSYTDRGRFGYSLAYYSFGRTDESEVTQHILHTDLVPPWRVGPPNLNAEKLHHYPDPYCIIGTN